MFCIALRFAQGEDKFRSDSFGADDIDIFSMQLDDFLDDGKSKSGSFFVFSAGQISLIEPFPDLFEAVLWNADTGIPDGDKDLFVPGSRF